MRYILDFDGVIFNTEILKVKMAELLGKEHVRNSSVFDALVEHDPSFELSALVYEDALVFLKEHEGACDIVSSFISSDEDNTDEVTIQAYQQTKIERCGVAEIVGGLHVHIVGISKAEKLAQLKDQYDAQGLLCIFVDDRKEHVQMAKDVGIRAFLMDRQGDGDFFEEEQISVIRNFKDLESKL